MEGDFAYCPHTQKEPRAERSIQVTTVYRATTAGELLIYMASDRIHIASHLVVEWLPRNLLEQFAWSLATHGCVVP